MSVATETRGWTQILSIQRPERRNAVDRATANALRDAFAEFNADSALRVLIITGAGGVFCAGADLKAFDNDVDHPDGPMGFTRAHSEKPVIAAIEGYCVAGGLEIALWADLRIASESAQFGCLERRFGVPLIDGGTQRLPQIVGLGRALDLILTGRLIDAPEAERIGLVNRVVPAGAALTAAVELAEQIAAFPFGCVLADRSSVYQGLGVPLREGLSQEAARGKAVLLDAARGADAFSKGAGRHAGS